MNPSGNGGWVLGLMVAFPAPFPLGYRGRSACAGSRQSGCAVGTRGAPTGPEAAQGLRRASARHKLKSKGASDVVLCMPH